MICYTALLVYRLLEAKLDRYGTHFTIENIIETLNNMEVANIEDMCYMSTYNNSQVCTALNAVFDLGLDKKYYQPKELNKKIKKISTCAVRFYSHTTKLGTQIQWICSFLGHYKRNLSLSEPDILIVILIDHFDSSKGTASML